MRSTITLCLVLALAASGCVGIVGTPDGDADAANASTSTSTVHAPGSAASGTLIVELTTPSRDPIADANITLEASDGTHTATTDQTGQAQLAGLAAGTAILTAQAPDHQGRQVTVEIPDEGDRRETLILRPNPDEGAVVQRYEFHGFFECSASYLIVAGDCLAAPRAVSEQAGGPSFNATNTRNTFRFPVHEGWSKIHITQTWEEPTVGTGSMMRLNLEPRNPNETEGHAPQYADVDGTSPIELTLENGELHGNATHEEMLVPEDGALLRTRTFHLGLAETHTPAGTDFLGTGAALQQPFTVIVEVHYP